MPWPDASDEPSQEEQMMGREPARMQEAHGHQAKGQCATSLLSVSLRAERGGQCVPDQLTTVPVKTTIRKWGEVADLCYLSHARP